MKATDQTVLHDPENGKHGNCFSAVVASLLHLPIEQVPVFENTNEKKWYEAVNAWLKPFGLAYLVLEKDVLDLYGITGCHHEISGDSPRRHDTSHAVVGLDGQQIHDPHPSRQGVQKNIQHGVFIVLRPWEVVEAACQP